MGGRVRPSLSLVQAYIPSVRPSRRIRKMQYFIIKFVGGQSLIICGVLCVAAAAIDTDNLAHYTLCLQTENEKSKANVWATNENDILGYFGFGRNCYGLLSGYCEPRLTRPAAKL